MISLRLSVSASSDPVSEALRSKPGRNIAAHTLRKIRKSAPGSKEMESSSKPSADATTREIAPAPVTAPGYSPRKPGEAPRSLKKGEIELVGTVESIGDEKGSLVMVVDQITMPKLKPIKLEPARSKTVFVKEIPPGIQVGTRITLSAGTPA